MSITDTLHQIAAMRAEYQPLASLEECYDAGLEGFVLDVDEHGFDGAMRLLNSRHKSVVQRLALHLKAEEAA